MTTTSAILLLLVIMDPLGNVANFIAGLRPVPPERRVRVIARELLFARAISRILKQKGAMAVERRMGMLLVMISVQMFLNGMERYLKHGSPLP